MAQSPTTDRYRFGVFEVDARAGELYRHGIRVRLRGKPIDILLALLARPGEVVSRETLREQLWPSDTFVDFDHGLNSAVNRLREALGETGDSPRFVETVPRRGYRFIGGLVPIEPAPTSPAGPMPSTPASAPELTPAPAAHRRSWMAVVIALCLAMASVATWILWHRPEPRRTSGRVMLAVLPFVDLAGDDEANYLTAGLTDELIAQLGIVQPKVLGVIARTTSERYKASGKSVMEIGDELGVDYVIEGSLRRAGDRIRLTTQLVDVGDQTPLWSETFERGMGDVLALQREVAVRVARSLAVEVLARELPMGTQSAEAYELYLRGRFLRRRATGDGALEGLEYFRQAIAIDPGYAAAYAGLADCYRLVGAPGWELRPPRQILEEARRSSERALELDPMLADAYAVRAIVRLNASWDATGAEADVLRAIELNPSLALAHQYHSSVLTVLGRHDEAIAAARRAYELDMLSPGASTTLGVRLMYAGRYGEARVQFRRTIESDPEFPVAWWGLGEVLREEGDTAGAVSALERAVALSGNSSYMRARLAYTRAAAGDLAAARATLADFDRGATADYVPPFHRALVLAGLGEREAVLTALERAADEGSGWIPFLRVDPAFRDLRRHSRFTRLVEQVH